MYTHQTPTSHREHYNFFASDLRFFGLPETLYDFA